MRHFGRISFSLLAAIPKPARRSLDRGNWIAGEFRIAYGLDWQFIGRLISQTIWSKGDGRGDELTLTVETSVVG